MAYDDNETELGYCWTVGYNSEAEGEVIIIDSGDECLTLSKSDLADMIKELGGIDEEIKEDR